MSLSIPGMGGRVPTWQRERPQQQPQGNGPSGSAAPEPGWVDAVSNSLAGGEGSRVQMAAINQAIQATEEGLALVSAARHGLEAVFHRLCRMGSVLGQIDSDPVAPEIWEEVLKALRADVQAIDRLATDTRCGEAALLDGSFGTMAAAFGPWLELVSAGPSVRSSPPDGFAAVLTQEPTRATILGTQELTASMIATGEILDAESVGRFASVTTRAGQSAAEVAMAFQAELNSLGLPLCVIAAGNERLLVHHRQYGKAWTFRVRSRTAGILSLRGGEWAEVANGRDVAGTLHGESAEGVGQVLTGIAGNRYTADLAVRYTGTPPPGFEPPEARSRGMGAAPRDGWKDGILEAGRILVVQRALRLRTAAPEPLLLRLDSMRCADLGRTAALERQISSLADVLQANPGQVVEVRAAVNRARQQVGVVLQQAGRVENQELAVHLNRLRTEAQNVIASQGPAGFPLDIGAWVDGVSQELRERGADALALQQCPRPAALLKLLGEGPEGELQLR
jgi:hypothetical protein